MKNAPEMDPTQSVIGRILDFARWAPSGDNTQPWRFELLGEYACRVHASDTRDWCLYDLRGRASQLAVGALLETLSIAASKEGFLVRMSRRPDAEETAPEIDVELVGSDAVQTDPLHAFITKRSTQRRSLERKALNPEHKTRLEENLPSGYSVIWLGGRQEKRRMARLLFRNSHIRLTIPEAYNVHKDVIEWNARYSEDRIPDQAVGLDALSLRLMRWAMKDWGRVDFLNRYLAGTLVPRIQLDYLPALNCGTHFALIADREPEGIDDYLSAGRALQRFWLSASSVGLQFQPEMTPLIFASYARDRIRFTEVESVLREADLVCRDLERILGEPNARRAVFAGRMGYGRSPESRSVRLGLPKLLWR